MLNIFRKEMGNVLKCLMKEYNLDDIDKIEDQEEIEQEEKKYSILTEMNGGRIKSEANIYMNEAYENSKNINHYSENFLDLKGENRKKSNTVFVKYNSKNNI